VNVKRKTAVLRAIFTSVGVPHVVAVRAGVKVLDAAAIFARHIPS
jgi:hypothetical protein